MRFVFEHRQGSLIAKYKVRVHLTEQQGGTPYLEVNRSSIFLAPILRVTKDATTEVEAAERAITPLFGINFMVCSQGK
jgi:hypothetical protein